MLFIKNKNLFFTFILLICLGVLSGCGLVRLGLHYPPSVTDNRFFDIDTLHAAQIPYKFEKEHDTIYLPKPYQWINEADKLIFDENTSIEKYLEKTKCNSFLVIQNNKLMYEYYAKDLPRLHKTDRKQKIEMGRNDISSTKNVEQKKKEKKERKKEKLAAEQLIVFSVSKAFTTTLFNIAMQKKMIDSTDYVYTYLPDFADNKFKQKLQLKHLLNMTSGLNAADDDKYKNYIYLARIYYGANMERMVANVPAKYLPGTHFAYKSLDTEILGLCLQKALAKHNINIMDFFQKEIWEPLGMEYDGYMTLDSKKNGNLRYFGGFAICPRDLAKLGCVALNKGNFNGKQIGDPAWYETLGQRKHGTDGKWYGYTLGWWSDTYLDKNLNEKNDFFAAGYSGQYIYVNRETNTVIVRTGVMYEEQRWVPNCYRLSQIINGKKINYNYLTKNDIEGKYYTTNAKGEKDTIQVQWIKPVLNSNEPNKAYYDKQWKVISTKKSLWKNDMVGYNLLKSIFTQYEPQSIRNSKANAELMFITEAQHKVTGFNFDTGTKFLQFYKLK